MAAVRQSVEAAHADFWMRKTTKAGEFTERAADGGYAWLQKP